MKKLIVTDPVRICGSDLTSGTSDEKRECMGYDTESKSGVNFAPKRHREALLKLLTLIVRNCRTRTTHSRIQTLAIRAVEVLVLHYLTYIC